MGPKYRMDPEYIKSYNDIISARLKGVKSSLDHSEPYPLPRNQNRALDHRAERIARDNASLVQRVNGQYMRYGTFSYLNNKEELAMRQQAVLVNEMRRQRYINEDNMIMVERLVNVKPVVSSRLSPKNYPRYANIRRLGATELTIDSGSPIAQRLEREERQDVTVSPPYATDTDYDPAQAYKMRIYMMTRK